MSHTFKVLFLRTLTCECCLKRSSRWLPEGGQNSEVQPLPIPEAIVSCANAATSAYLSPSICIFLGGLAMEKAHALLR